MDDIERIRALYLRTITRRRLLQGAVAGAATYGVLGSLGTAAAGVKRTSAKPQVAQDLAVCTRNPSVFDEHTFDTLHAITAQIVPTDSTLGAADFCVVNFIENNAAGNPGLHGLLTGGVAALDAASNVGFSDDFVDLLFVDQTAVLQQFETGDDFQKAFFGACRGLTKTAWVINWPEAFVRDANGQPLFFGDTHSISDPDDPLTETCWTQIKFHVIDWDTEVLLWAWQAGLEVIDFQLGWPVFSNDLDNPLPDQQRLEARDALYALSDAGVA
jgi:hypothetical protein